MEISQVSFSRPFNCYANNKDITFVEDISIDTLFKKKINARYYGNIHKNEAVDNFVFFNPKRNISDWWIRKYLCSYNKPRDVYGEAIAMAAQANAQLVDLEFVNFIQRLDVD